MFDKLTALRKLFLYEGLGFRLVKCMIQIRKTVTFGLQKHPKVESHGMKRKDTIQQYNVMLFAISCMIYIKGVFIIFEKSG